MRNPGFWYRPPGLGAALLAPAAWLWGRGARRRARRGARAVRLDVPTLCVGNLVAGGAGKTPTAATLAVAATGLGRRPAIVSRGYGGRSATPVRVEPGAHDYRQVGDEPLLLARLAPTWVGRDRVATARAACAGGADCLILDDGFQDPGLAKTASLVVIDGPAGFGNRRLIPAGPLREAIADGLARAQGAIVIGPTDADTSADLAAAGLPVFAAVLEPDPSGLPDLGQGAWVAFAGIGRPDKFFATLRTAGASLAGTVAFPDHHPYRAGDLEDLAARAGRCQARLITTAKDAVRLPPEARDGIAILPVRLRFADAELLGRRLADWLAP